jgi:vitamin B12 transporter
MKHLNTSLAALLAAALSSPVAHAKQHTQLDDMIVTATRTQSIAVEALSSVSVITQDEIETFQYQTLADALSSLAGVSISHAGGLGKQTSLFVRGTESNHTQILLNGVKLATNGFGTPQIEHIPLDSIERIEIVRGPQSGLYGSSSIGGTIQIFTKKAPSGFSPFAMAAIGSDNTHKMNAGFGASNELGWLNIAAGYTGTDGFDACDGRSATFFIGCFADEPDDDGYQNRHHSLRGGVYLGENSELELFSLYSSGDSQYDGFFNHTDFSQHTYGGVITSKLSDQWQLRSHLSHAHFDVDDKGVFATSESDNTKQMFSLQSDYTLTERHILTVGYDYEQDERDTASADRVERDNHGVFGQFQGGINKLDYRLTFRHDDNQQYGQFNSGNIAFGYHFTPSLKSYIHYGEAFTAPSFIDLDPASFGNPNLVPEQSKSVEIGISGRHAATAWSIAAFHTKIENLIALDSFFIPQNIAKAKIKGVELTAQRQWLSIDWDAQLSLIDPTFDTEDSNKGNVLPRRAQNTMTIKAAKSWNKLSLASQVYYSGRRFDNNANTRRLDNHVTVDVTVGYQVTAATAIRLKLANLFDESYETASGFNANDLNALLSISYRP